MQKTHVSVLVYAAPKAASHPFNYKSYRHSESGHRAGIQRRVLLVLPVQHPVRRDDAIWESGWSPAELNRVGAGGPDVGGGHAFRLRLHGVNTAPPTLGGTQGIEGLQAVLILAEGPQNLRGIYEL